MNYRWAGLIVIVVLMCAGQALAAPALRTIRTRHYEMHTDLPEDLVRDFAGRMDAMYDEYARRLSDFKPPTDAQSLPVYLFRSHDDYVAFTHTEHTGGVFVSNGERSFLASFLEGQGREGMGHTLQHEAFHQFAFYVVSPNLPTWLNEGIAELYNDAIWTGSRYIIGEVYPRRVRRINEDIKNHSFVRFEKMLSMDHNTWNQSLSAKDETATTYYNQAWAMVYFLTQSNSAQPKQMTAYLKQLHDGGDPNASWKTFFPDTEKLQNQFANWVTSVHPTPGGTLIERQEVLGDFYVAAKQYRNFKSLPDFRNFVTASGMWITYKVGGVKWKTDRGDVYFRNLNNDIWQDNQLFFEDRAGSEPDIVCIPDGKTTMRTRFYGSGKSMEHELLFDVDPHKSGSNVQMGGLHKGSGLQGLH